MAIPTNRIQTASESSNEYFIVGILRFLVIGGPTARRVFTEPFGARFLAAAAA
jgi:hypothetical protein